MILDSKGCAVINATEWIRELTKQGWRSNPARSIPGVEQRLLSTIKVVPREGSGFPLDNTQALLFKTKASL